MEVRLEEVERELRGVKSLDGLTGMGEEEEEARAQEQTEVEMAESVIADERDERWCRSVVNLEESDVGDEGRYEEIRREKKKRETVEKGSITELPTSSSPASYDADKAEPLALATGKDE